MYVWPTICNPDITLLCFKSLLFFQFYNFDFSLSIYFGRHFNFDYIACVRVCVLDSNTYNPNSTPSFTHAYLYKIHTYIHTYICIIDSTPLGPQADFSIYNFFFLNCHGCCATNICALWLIWKFKYAKPKPYFEWSFFPILLWLPFNDWGWNTMSTALMENIVVGNIYL